MAATRSFLRHKLIKFLLALYIGLFMIIWLVSSPIIKAQLTPYLAQEKLILAKESSIRYNPFLSKLTLSDISLSSEDEPSVAVFSLKNFEIKLTLFQLLFDEINIAQLQLNDGFIHIKQTDETLYVAGININKEATDTNKAPAENSEQLSFPYQLVLPKLLLENFEIALEKKSAHGKEKLHHLKLERIEVNELTATLIEQQANIVLQAQIDDTELNFSAQAHFQQGEGKIISDLALNNYPLVKLQPYLEPVSSLSGQLSLNSKQAIDILKSGLTITIESAQLSNKNLAAKVNQQELTLASFVQNFSNVIVTVEQDELTNIQGTSDIKLAQASINQEDNSKQLLSFDNLLMEDISFHFIEQPSIKIADLIIDDIAASKLNDQQQLPALVTLKQFSINDINLTKTNLAVNEIILDTLQSDVIVLKDKVIANLIKLAQEESAAQAQASQPNEQQLAQQPSQQQSAIDNAFTFTLNKFALVNDNKVVLTDNSVEPVVTRTLNIEKLDLGRISNDAASQEKTPFHFAGKSNKYAHFNLTGHIQPFVDVPNYHVEGYLKELSLVALSSYLKKAASLEVKTGQLSTDLNINLIGDELDGNMLLHLQGLETGIVDSHEAGSLIEQGALPLNMALGMLKDRNGAVELDVPVSGSTSDPKFGLSSILTLITQKAIMSATQDYLITTFVPYANIVSVAITAGEFALKLRFDDVDYQVKQIEPESAQQKYMQDFIALMQDKKDTKVTICAISVPEDIGLPAGKALTDPANIKRLKELGEQREHAFKDYVIEHGKIESSRLLLCAPKIDSSKGAKPRIALSV
ncbi:DUF748 domain-containing protein [Litorilituus sediminis]|uniref:DUF748 domain-containing protein n=1 Tax=Litorilituus sediminis TaxID=718192 RepID=A0A4P6P8P4_9GAMM|nr:DUF748 domain-containing protein [Litorilituus sediminis]QBG35932.1 DUF748 domain-containing protein [Litorilituus sediminis]